MGFSRATRRKNVSSLRTSVSKFLELEILSFWCTKVDPSISSLPPPYPPHPPTSYVLQVDLCTETLTLNILDLDQHWHICGTDYSNLTNCNSSSLDTEILCRDVFFRSSSSRKEVLEMFRRPCSFLWKRRLTRNSSKKSFLAKRQLSLWMSTAER